MSTKPFDLSGKIAIVTGSSRGIGRSIAEVLAAQGAKVVVSARQADSCQPTLDAICANGGDAHVVACNITRRAEVENLVAQTQKHYGGVDILVCNAAINPVYGPMANLTDDVFTKMMTANVQSNIWFANLCGPIMAERGGGSIILVSSIAGFRGTDALGMYAITKTADFGVARSLAVEWGPKNVRVNCIAPGLIKTDFAKALWDNPEFLNKRLATTPLRRIGEPDEIGGIAAFLASTSASFITGQIIVADGGVTVG